MITRRGLLKGVGALALTGFATTAYAGWVEPMWMMRTKRYAFRPPNWTNAPDLRIAVLADIHACRPWMPPERIAAIVAQTNALKPDLTLLLGDYVHGTNLIRDAVTDQEWAAELARL
ncbi:twin-arginine translocation signal domain-containing protein, partial [Escherichia coli]|nr:twin-arginine translocation signal domain-containing protein [Escherichia coli]